MVIKIHSLVDVITNSSTVIFTWASGNSEAMVLELIDEVLAVAGSDKKAKDLYDVKVQVAGGADNVPNWMDFYPDTEIVVTRKDGKETRVDKILGNLFSSDGYYDG